MLFATNPERARDLRGQRGSTHWPRWVSCSVALFVLMLSGCWGGAESYVSGTVTLDGTPLESGSVMFLPTESKGRAASGSIEAGGSYKVQAGQTGGLPKGNYKVKVSSRSPSKPHPGGGPPAPGKLLTPERYRNVNTSGLEFSLRSGSNKIDLGLTTQ